MTTRPGRIRKVREGEIVSAMLWNSLADSVNALLDASERPNEPVDKPPVRMVELQRDHDEYAAGGKEIKALSIEPDNDATSSVVLVSEEDFADTLDVLGGVHLQGERTAVSFHKPSGYHLMLPFTHWHLAVMYEDLAPTDTTGAYAQVYEVLASGEVLSPLDKVRVYSWGTSATFSAGDEVFIIQHRQSRRWYVISSGGAAFEWIAFTIVTADCENNSAEVTVDKTSCGMAGAVTDELASGTVIVYDDLGCFLNEPNADLVGRRGQAILAQTDTSGCEWQISALCCYEDTC